MGWLLVVKDEYCMAFPSFPHWERKEKLSFPKSCQCEKGLNVTLKDVEHLTYSLIWVMLSLSYASVLADLCPLAVYAGRVERKKMTGRECMCVAVCTLTILGRGGRQS